MTDRKHASGQRGRTDNEDEPPSGERPQQRQEGAARESPYTDELLDAIDDMLRAGLGFDDDEIVDDATFENACERSVSTFVQIGGQ